MLDRLGERERDACPSDLTERIVSQTRESLPASMPELDALAAAERNAAPEGLEDRIVASTVELLQADTSDLDALGAHERASMSQSLEDRIFMMTGSTISGRDSTVATEEHDDAPRVAGSIWSTPWIRYAAAACFAIVGTAAVLLVGNGNQELPIDDGYGEDRIAQNMSFEDGLDRLDSLFSISDMHESAVTSSLAAGHLYNWEMRP